MANNLKIVANNLKIVANNLFIFQDLRERAVQKRTLDAYPSDDAWEFINLTLLCVAWLFSERKGSMCPGVMVENAKEDARTECSICQPCCYAKRCSVMSALCFRKGIWMLAFGSIAANPKT